MSLDNFNNSEIQGIIQGTVSKVNELLKSSGSLNNSRCSSKNRAYNDESTADNTKKKFSFGCVNLANSRNDSGEPVRKEILVEMKPME